MWFLIDRLFQLTLLVVSAAALFVVGAVIASPDRTDGAATDLPLSADDRSEEARTDIVQAADGASEGARTDVMPTGDDPSVEIRLSSRGTSSWVFVGQPLVVDVELTNLQNLEADRQVPLAAAGNIGEREIRLDRGTTPWERRLALYVKANGAMVIERVDSRTHLLDPDPAASNRRLGSAPARTTFILDLQALAEVPPGTLEIGATLPADLVPPDRLRIAPLMLELRPPPTNDPDRAAINLAAARVAALRGESAAAIEAGMAALALDPLRDEALRIVAESWEQQGDLDRAVEWYGRYLETIPDSAAEDRDELESHIDALRRQR